MDPTLKSSFPPVVDTRTRVLILGSLPGEISLQRGQYYANPRNQFWRLVAAVTRSPVPEAYDARLDHLRAAGIGLWDTVATARRAGSLDGAIRDPRPNALPALVAGLPALRAIAFNGATAAKIGRAQLAQAPPLLDLPSSSPAHTLAFDRKLEAWLRLRPYLAG